MMDFLMVLLVSTAAVVVAENVSVSLDGGTALHRYDGHGGLSAGASSRLLWDYPEPQRSQVLDYLFKPSFGAGMHQLKLEIGGDGQSTDGTEPSHMHTRDDLSCERGYELWLATEARKRNPNIALYGLAWTAPGWVNNGTMYGPDTIEYMLAWLRCVRLRVGGDVQTLGLWNEAAQPSASYVIELRAALDAAGFGATRVAVMDNAYMNTDEVAEAQANASYAAAIGVAGLHDPCSYNYKPYPEIRELGWDLWSSEDFSRDVSGWDNSQNYWMKALSQHYVVMNITATISWSLIWSVYPNLICRDSGLMRARWPQSGYYEVSPTIWLHAHWGQFVSPGWRFLHVPGGGSGFLDVAGASLHGGTYVSLVPPDRLDELTVIIETSADSSCLRRNLSHFTVTFTTRGGLPGPGTKLYVWSSTQSALFRQLSPLIIAADSSFSLTVAPDSITTVSTVATASHGSFPDSPVPANLPWPLPYSDNFGNYSYDAMARYFADQAGSWAVRNGSLMQVSFGQPIAWAPNGDPLSIVGSDEWVDYAVSATARFWPKTPALEIPTSPQRGGGAVGVGADAGIGAGDSVVFERHNKGRFGSESNSASLYASPCDANDGAQIFTHDSSTGWLGSAWGAGGSGCATTCGCDPTCLQMWGCGVPGCSTSAYNWTLQKQSGGGGGGAVTNEAYPGLALTADAATSTVALVAVKSGSPAQMWQFDGTSGLLRSELGLCLSQQRPSLVYATVCGRVGAYNGFDAKTTPAYCAAVYTNTSGSATWALLVNSQAVAFGDVAVPPGGGVFNSSAPHRISLSMSGDIIEAYLDGDQLVSVTDDTYASGNAAIGAGWHPAAFDDFDVTVPFADTVAAATRKRSAHREDT